MSDNTSIPNGTSWDNPVTVAANPGDIVTIKPGSGKAFFWILDGQDKYLIIDGFIVDGQNVAWHGLKSSNGTRYIRLQNSEIKNSRYTGIIVTNSKADQAIYGAPADTYHEFRNLHVHHNGSSVKDHGFYIESGRNLVEYSDIHHNSGNGGKFYMDRSFGGGGTANYNIFRYSTTHDNSTNCSEGLCTGWLLGSGKGNQAYGNISYNQKVGFAIGSDAIGALLYNNIAYNNSLYGIHIYGDWGGSDDALVYNNTVYNNPLYGIGVREGAKNTTIKNNIAYSNGTSSSSNIYLQPNKSPGTFLENNLQTDPKFVDPLDHDFKLQPGSSAIDSGVNIQEVKVDFFGVKRYQGEAYDIGAIEHDLIGSSSFPPPIVSPAPDSRLTSTSVTFSGGHSSQDAQHWVYVGSTPEGKDYYAGDMDGNHQFTVSGLPSTGTIYVRYLSRTSSTSAWQTQAHSYTMSVDDGMPPATPTGFIIRQ
jgi:parallel beta-helix repeat protein